MIIRRQTTTQTILFNPYPKYIFLVFHQQHFQDFEETPERETPMQKVSPPIIKPEYVYTTYLHNNEPNHDPLTFV